MPNTAVGCIQLNPPRLLHSLVSPESVNPQEARAQTSTPLGASRSQRAWSPDTELNSTTRRRGGGASVRLKNTRFGRIWVLCDEIPPLSCEWCLGVRFKSFRGADSGPFIVFSVCCWGQNGFKISSVPIVSGHLLNPNVVQKRCG